MIRAKILRICQEYNLFDIEEYHGLNKYEFEDAVKSFKEDDETIEEVINRLKDNESTAVGWRRAMKKYELKEIK